MTTFQRIRAGSFNQSAVAPLAVFSYLLGTRGPCLSVGDWGYADREHVATGTARTGWASPSPTPLEERRIIVAISHGSSLKPVSLGMVSSLDKQNGMEGSYWKIV